jgi:hypothetical protein
VAAGNYISAGYPARTSALLILLLILSFYCSTIYLQAIQHAPLHYSFYYSLQGGLVFRLLPLDLLLLLILLLMLLLIFLLILSFTLILLLSQLYLQHAPARLGCPLVAA